MVGYFHCFHTTKQALSGLWGQARASVTHTPTHTCQGDLSLWLPHFLFVPQSTGVTKPGYCDKYEVQHSLLREHTSLKSSSSGHRGLYLRLHVFTSPLATCPFALLPESLAPLGKKATQWDAAQPVYPLKGLHRLTNMGLINSPSTRKVRHCICSIHNASMTTIYLARCWLKVKYNRLI